MSSLKRIFSPILRGKIFCQGVFLSRCDHNSYNTRVFTVLQLNKGGFKNCINKFVVTQVACCC